LYFANTGSTNEEARRLLRQNPAYPQELLLVADEQTAGRGRLGRIWMAPPASGLLCTLAFRLAPLPLDRAFLYVAALALSVVQATEQFQPSAGVQLKWPNDLVREGKKVGGILTELENNLGQAGNESWLVLGFGLNLSLSTEDLTEAGLSANATNLTSQPFEREQLLATILHYFAEYRVLLASSPDTVQQEWTTALSTLGHEVHVLNSEGQVQIAGVATGVTKDGSLIVQDKAGLQHFVQAGDVSIRRPDGSYSV
jgi:BirA family biotin operon repressor/biotin-[acetyl-CoA-carboxylase] ligase